MMPFYKTRGSKKIIRWNTYFSGDFQTESSRTQWSELIFFFFTVLFWKVPVDCKFCVCCLYSSATITVECVLFQKRIYCSSAWQVKDGWPFLLVWHGNSPGLISNNLVRLFRYWRNHLNGLSIELVDIQPSCCIRLFIIAMPKNAIV